MRKRGNRMRLLLTVLMTAFILTVCSSAFPAAGSQADLSGGSPPSAPEARPDGEASPSTPDDSVRSAVNFDHELDSYVPQKDHYNFCNCSVHSQINIKFQKENWAVMSNNKP